MEESCDSKASFVSGVNRPVPEELVADASVHRELTNSKAVAGGSGKLAVAEDSLRDEKADNPSWDAPLGDGFDRSVSILDGGSS